MDAVKRQRDYYQSTAEEYDKMHMADEEHTYALSIMEGLVKQLEISSVLDIGSGTGRAVLALKHSGVRAVGIEPVEALRKQGHTKGLSTEELIDGDVQILNFPDKSFDLVCAFAVLHHVPEPIRAVSEMLRVARRAIFISDSNNFGQGGTAIRLAKQTLRGTGLWKIADFIKTRGKGYTITEGDGLAYSYSIFDNHAQIASRCRDVRYFAVSPSGPNLYRTCSHVAVLGQL
jgi:ubiquinone/menaquinone biosynthesis C-methylase UbiE